MWEQILIYFQMNSDRWFMMLKDHVTISFSSLLIAVCIALPAGILCVKFDRFEKFIASIFGFLRVIPSLAILLLMIPIIGTGIVPAITALVILALPPILMNTVAGLKTVPFFMLETAKSLGMTNKQVWIKVKIPLALPIILTGIKTAAVEIIASATLAAKIGAGGFGDIIFAGIGVFQTDLLLIGGISVAILSLLTNFFFELLDKILLRHNKL